MDRNQTCNNRAAVALVLAVMGALLWFTGLPDNHPGPYPSCFDLAAKAAAAPGDKCNPVH
jgi:hypothetical protein